MGNADQSKALVRRFYDEIWNERKLDVADEIFSPEHRFHDPSSPNVPNGPRGIKDDVSTYHRAFQDGRVNIQDLNCSADGNTVYARWTGTGTHTGELMGIAPTRKKVTVTGIDLYRVSGNRITETWTNWDTLGLLQQLGVVPASTSSRR